MSVINKSAVYIHWNYVYMDKILITVTKFVLDNSKENKKKKKSKPNKPASRRIFKANKSVLGNKI